MTTIQTIGAILLGLAMIPAIALIWVLCISIIKDIKKEK